MPFGLLVRTKRTSPAPLAGDASFEPKASVRVTPLDAAESDELQRARVRAAPSTCSDILAAELAYKSKALQEQCTRRMPRCGSLMPETPDL
jgi:hypothetical protein